MYLFDSDVIIDFLKGKNLGFFKISDFLNKKTYLSIASWIELTYGIKRSKSQIQDFNDFEYFLETFSITLLPIDEKVASQFVDIKIHLEEERRLLEDFDLLIASTALVHNLLLVTRNKKHFSRIKNLLLV